MSDSTDEPDEGRQIERLLWAWEQGDLEAFRELFELLYRELRRMAHHYLRRELHATMQTTELVHEIYTRLFRSTVELTDRRHFLNLAARSMRQVLVEQARSRSAGKRNGWKVELKEAIDAPAASIPDEELLAFDEVLRRLEALDKRKAQAVELHGLFGFTIEETAGLLEVDRSTVHRDWVFAKAWLRKELDGREGR